MNLNTRLEMNDFMCVAFFAGRLMTGSTPPLCRHSLAFLYVVRHARSREASGYTKQVSK